MKEKSTRYRNYNAIPVFIASYMLFGCRNNMLDYLHQDSFFENSDEFKKNIFKLSSLDVSSAACFKPDGSTVSYAFFVPWS